MLIEVKEISVKDKGERFKNDFHTLTINLKVLDDTVEVINQDFSIDYKAIHNLAEKMVELEKQMSEVITVYKTEKAILSQLKTEASKMQTLLIEKEVK